MEGKLFKFFTEKCVQKAKDLKTKEIDFMDLYFNANERKALSPDITSEDGFYYYIKEFIEDAKLLQEEDEAALAKMIQIFVRGYDGKTIMLTLALSSTVKDVKEMIHAKVGISLDRQRLLYEGKELEDCCTLSDCKIQNQCTLMLWLRWEIVPQYLYAKVSYGNIIRFELNGCNAQVERVKERIEEETGIPKDQQILSLNGEELKNGTEINFHTYDFKSILKVDRRV